MLTAVLAATFGLLGILSAAFVVLKRRESAQSERLREPSLDDLFRDLFQMLSRDVETDRRAQRLLQELRAQTCTEVFDSERLRESILAGMKQAVGEWPVPILDRRQDELIGAVLDAEDGRAMERVLDRINVMLPFVEQLPVRSERETVWRPLMEVKALRRKPLDDTRFRYVLDRLDRLIRRSDASRHPKSNRDAVDAVLRLRRSLESPGANFGHYLRHVERGVELWLDQAHFRDGSARQGELEKWIAEAEAYRRRIGRFFALWGQDDGAAVEAERLAAFYREREWMKRPEATRVVIAMLLDAEIARLPLRNRRSWLPVLRRMRNEVAAGYFDKNEILRRVQKLEDSGLYVHSLVSALLRMDDKPTVRPPIGRAKVEPGPLGEQ